MASQNEGRQIRLGLRGESFRRREIPATILAAKLQALQNLLFHAAATVAADRSGRRGLWYNRYRDVAELAFVAAQQSDLVVVVELPQLPARAGAVDIGLQALDLVFRMGAAIQANALEALTMGRDERNYLLRAFEGLLPNSLDDYQVELENGSPGRHGKLSFSGASRQQVRAWLQMGQSPLQAEIVTLIGELVKIHLGVGPEKIAIRHKGVEIDCFYPDWLRDEVANLLAGSYVEVTGWATWDNEGHVVRMDSVLDVEPVSMDPLRLTRFEYGGIRHALHKPLLINVTYTDGMWVYHNEAFNLWGHGERREDALRDLHENFVYLWKELAEESDALLDDKALAIKNAFLELQTAE